MTASLLVPEKALDKVLKRLGKLAKTAGVSLEILPGTTTLIRDKQVITCARLTVGDLPSAGGYEFVARIEHLKGGNALSKAPSETHHELDAAWRSAKGSCEHCGASRLRKETFLVRQSGKRLMQIGRNCLADFLMTNPAQMVAQAELVKEISEGWDDEYWARGGGGWEIATVAFVACAVSSVERHGFRKSGLAMSTKNDATFLARPPPPTPDSRVGEIWLKEQPTEAQIQKATAIARWALGLTEQDLKTEYLWNLHIAMKQQGVGKHAGLLASAPTAYDRAMGVVHEKKKQLTLAADGYAVEKDFIFKGEVTLIRRAVVASNFGAKTICTFRSDAGHEIVWFATGSAPGEGYGPSVGARFVIKGRCKKHENYKGTKQTVLSRVSWKAIEVSVDSGGEKVQESA